MATYNDVYGLLMRSLPDSVAVSLPVPMVRNAKLYDLFFTYAVSRAPRLVRRPITCYAVLMSDGRVADLGDTFGFSSIDFEDSPVAGLDDFVDNLLAAREIYERARDEVASGEPGEAMKRYSELVGKTAQPCLLPYYRAMGMQFE